MGRESMRDNYNRLGVDGYYAAVGSTYANPHYPDLVRVMAKLLPTFETSNLECPLNCHHLGQGTKPSLKVFDIAAGSGEMTCTIQKWVESKDETVCMNACDPFTQEAHAQRTGWPCLSLSFQDIATQSPAFDAAFFQTDEYAFETKRTRIFDVCLCSFALHLCKESMLYPLLSQLSILTRYFVIISPHKKPILTEDELSRSGFKTKTQYVQDRIHVRVLESLLN